MGSIFENLEFKIFVPRVKKAINEGKTPEDVAKRVHEVCREYCLQLGMNPDLETFCRLEREGVWKVSFEAGPYQWAIAASLSHDNYKVLCEPYYSFDLECSAN